MALAVAAVCAPAFASAQQAPATASAAAPVPKAAALPDVERLQAENIALRAELLDTQKALVSLRAQAAAGLLDVEKKLAADAKAFEPLAVKALGGGPSDVFDWATMRLKAATPPGK